MSKEVLEAAKAMAQEALQKKLQEIEMSEEDAVLYEDYAYAVKGQVSQLRTMLQGLQSKYKITHDTHARTRTHRTRTHTHTHTQNQR